MSSARRFVTGSPRERDRRVSHRANFPLATKIIEIVGSSGGRNSRGTRLRTSERASTSSNRGARSPERYGAEKAVMILSFLSRSAGRIFPAGIGIRRALIVRRHNEPERPGARITARVR